MEGAAFGASLGQPSTSGSQPLLATPAWIANFTVTGSLRVSSLFFAATTYTSGVIVPVQFDIPIRVSLIREVPVSSPVSPLRRSGLFADPVQRARQAASNSSGGSGVFSTAKLNLGGDTNRTIPTLLEIPIPSVAMLLAAVEGRSAIAATYLRDGFVPAANAMLSLETAVSSLQGRRTLPQGVADGTLLRCQQHGSIRIAAVALKPPSDSDSFVTDSAFDFRSVATVTRAGLMDSASNANMLNLLREHGINSLVYPDLLPRPKVVLTDNRTTIAEANASGWARLMAAAGSPDTLVPADIPTGFQQAVRSPLPTPTNSTPAEPAPAPQAPLPLAGVKEFGFPVPEGAQRWFGVGHNLPSAQTTFRFIFENSYENVPVFAGPPYNGTLNPEFERMFRMVLLATAEQINASDPGLLGRCHALLIDEVYLSVPETRRNWAALASLHRAVLPQVRLWQTAAIPDILQLSDEEVALAYTWVVNSPTPDSLVALEARIDRAMRNASNARAERPRILLYDNGVPALDMPLLRQRLFHWGAWLSNNPFGTFNGTASRGLGVSGTLSFYTVAAWGPTTQAVSVWEDPSAQDPVHRRPGWGLLVYPPEGGSPADPVTLGGESDPVVPVTSLRMVAMRSGLQDVELLRQLAQTVAYNASRCPPTSCVERARQFGQTLLRTQLPEVASWIPLDWSKTWRDSFSNSSYTIDPNQVNSFRRAALSVIAAIPAPGREL